MHLNRTLEGKVFVGFLSLVLRSHMAYVLRSCVETKHLTFEKVLLELEKIRAVTLDDKTQMITPLTKLQRIIFETLKVPLGALTTHSTA